MSIFARVSTKKNSIELAKVLVLLFIFFNPAASQSQTTKGDSLEAACIEHYLSLSELYKVGKYDQVIDSFERYSDCIRGYFPFRIYSSTSTRLSLFNVMIQTYMEKHEDEKALQYFEKILKLDPTYPYAGGATEPVLNLLADKYRVSVLTFGAKIGYNWSIPSVQKRFSRTNVEVESEQYKFQLWNIHNGAFIGFRPSRRQPFEFFLEYFFAARSYGYKGNYNITFPDLSQDMANFRFSERMAWDNLVFYTRYHIMPKRLSIGNRASFYGLFGGGVSFLQASRLEDLEISFDENTPRNKSLKALDITNCSNNGSIRESTRVNALLGGGMKYKISPQFFLTLEARYDIILNNVVNVENREACSTLLDDFFYLDNDMIIHSLFISGGVNLQLYLPKKRKKIK